MQRQPFGGWKKAAVGAGAKAGGPNYLVGLGTWSDAPPSGDSGAPDGLALRVAAVAKRAGISSRERGWLAAALATDQRAWAQEFGISRDITGLTVEHNVLRYRAVPVTIRVEDSTCACLLRIVAAGLRAQSPLTISAAPPLAADLRGPLAELGIEIHVEDRARWTVRATRLAADAGRVRLLGGSAAELAGTVHGAPSLAIYGGEVVCAGRVELLTFLREQAMSITAHRFGTPHRYAFASAGTAPDGSVTR